MKNLKLRYYLRGLGIGILVTALIIGIAGKEDGPMTDAQIRERALELGMVDADSIVLSELQGHKDEESETVVPESETEEIAEAETTGAESEAGTSEEEEEVPDETETMNEEETSEEEHVETAETEHSEETEEASTIITFEIRSGASSYGVSKDLEAAGLIEDAGEYDTYLCDNGYSRSIRVGTYEIAIGTGEEEIAKIITGKR